MKGKSLPKPRIGTVLKWKVNSLARYFYSLHGYNVQEGYDFSTAPHPQERLMWAMALESYQYWMEGK